MRTPKPIILSIGIGCLSALMLSSCSSSSNDSLQGITQSGPQTQDNSHASSKNGADVSLGAADDEQEGPQYQSPTIDNLRGIPQRFPARYAVRKYPKSQVVLVDVRPHLFGGQKNQVMLRSSDPPKVIAAYYKTDLSKDGWELVHSYENTIYSSTTWQKNGLEVEVRVSPDPYNRENIQLISGPAFTRPKLSQPPSKG